MTPKELKAHIQTFFGDKTRKASATLKGLEEAQDEIEMLIDALRAEGVR